MDLNEYRKASYENWDRIAVNWESEREFILAALGEVSNRLVDELDPQAGETVLDIAAGTGDTGFLVADRLGDSGKLISTDFAPGMVEAAKRVGEARGVTNAEFRVLDAENMDLDDGSVDRVICRFGYMLMADPAAALAETRRVLREGGRLAFAVWTAPDDNLWAFIPAKVLVERGHFPPPEPGAPGIFAMADPERIRSLVTGAGFAEPTLDQVDVSWPYTGSEDHWKFTLKLAGPLADAVSKVDEEEREAIRSEVESRVAPLMANGGSLTGRIHLVTTS